MTDADMKLEDFEKVRQLITDAVMKELSTKYTIKRLTAQKVADRIMRMCKQSGYGFEL